MLSAIVLWFFPPKIANKRDTGEGQPPLPCRPQRKHSNMEDFAEIVYMDPPKPFPDIWDSDVAHIRERVEHIESMRSNPHHRLPAVQKKAFHSYWKDCVFLLGYVIDPDDYNDQEKVERRKTALMAKSKNTRTRSSATVC